MVDFEHVHVILNKSINISYIFVLTPHPHAHTLERDLYRVFFSLRVVMD